MLNAVMGSGARYEPAVAWFLNSGAQLRGPLVAAAMLTINGAVTVTSS